MSGLESSYIDNFMGNPFNFAFFPGAAYDDVVLNTFFDRVWNLVENCKDSLTFYRYTSDQTNIMRKYLGQDLPDVRQLERNVTLALVNSHYSFHGIRSVAPALIEVGGLHIQNGEIPLPPVSFVKKKILFSNVVPISPSSVLFITWLIMSYRALATNDAIFDFKYRHKNVARPLVI